MVDPETVDPVLEPMLSAFYPVHVPTMTGITMPTYVPSRPVVKISEEIVANYKAALMSYRQPRVASAPTQAALDPVRADGEAGAQPQAQSCTCACGSRVS